MSKFTNECSRMNVVYLIKSKDQDIDTLTRFMEDVITPNKFRLEQLRSDCGTSTQLDTTTSTVRRLGSNKK